jgi:hypothetical protein
MREVDKLFKAYFVVRIEFLVSARISSVMSIAGISMKAIYNSGFENL